MAAFGKWVRKAAVSAGRLLWAISKAAILNQRDRGSARSYPIRRYFGEHGPVFSREGLAQWQQAETRLLGALTDYTRVAQSTSQGRLFAEDALQG